MSERRSAQRQEQPLEHPLKSKLLREQTHEKEKLRMSIISRFRWLTSLAVALTLSLVFVFSPLFVLSTHAQTLLAGTTGSATSQVQMTVSTSLRCSQCCSRNMAKGCQCCSQNMAKGCRCCSGDMDRDEGCQCCSQNMAKGCRCCSG